MSQQTTFVLHTYQSPYGDYIRLETDASTADVEDPHMYARGVMPCGSFRKVTVKPGDNIFLNTCEGDDKGSQIYLIVIPSDKHDFTAFKQIAEAAAGEEVYEHILASQQGHGGPYNYVQDFEGKWLRQFIMRSWTDDRNAPSNLQEALASR